jgi:preprotein translocase subunit SecA
MFTVMMEGIKEESVGFLFYADVNVEAEPEIESDADAEAELVEVDGDEGIAAVEPPRVTGGPTPVPPAPAAEADDHAKVANVLGKAFAAPNRPGNLQYSAPTVDGEGGVERTAVAATGGTFDNVSRNAPCPCGSGRKYKRCHGAPQGVA